MGEPNQVISAVEVRADVYDEIERLIRKEVNRTIDPQWRHLHADAPEIKWQGCVLMRVE